MFRAPAGFSAAEGCSTVDCSGRWCCSTCQSSHILCTVLECPLAGPCGVVIDRTYDSISLSLQRAALCVCSTVSSAFTCHVLDGREPVLKEAAWGDLRVGNIVRVYCGECVPADLLILTCGHSESAVLDLRMVDGAASFTRRYCVRETKADYSLTALAGLRGRVVCESPAGGSPHFKGTIRLDARPRGTRIVASNVAPRGSILRWTEWIDGLVLHAAEDVAFYQSRRSCKEGNRELDSACSVVVGVFAVVTLLLGVYKTQLSQWLFLLSCGPVALSFALDIVKLRRRENLSYPISLLRERCADSARMRQAWEHRDPHAEQRGHHQQQKCPSSDEGCCASAVFGQLISPSALDDLARADFLLFDKGAVVDGSTLHLRGVCAGGACFARRLAEDLQSGDDLEIGDRLCGSTESAGVPLDLSSDCPSQDERTVDGGGAGSQDIIDSKAMLSFYGSERSLAVRCGRCDIEMEDMSTIEHYYTTHRDERGRLEVLAQIASICHCATPFLSRRTQEGRKEGVDEVAGVPDAVRAQVEVDFQSTLPEDPVVLNLCSALGYKPVLRRGTQLHIERSPIRMPDCPCQFQQAEPLLAPTTPRGAPCRPSSGGGTPAEGNCSCCRATPLQTLVEAVFGEKLCASNCHPVSLVEVVGSHAPSQRRPRLSCVVKPMGHRSGALLVVRGPAADIAKLCRGGLDALKRIEQGMTLAERPQGVACRTGSSSSSSGSEAEKALEHNTDAPDGNTAVGGEERQDDGDAEYVKQVLLAAQRFSLEGSQPLLFAARALSAEELALYIQLSEEASNSMYRQEERQERVITSFETDLQLVGCVAVTEELQPGVRKSLAKIKEVGIRQIFLVGGDKHAALATARHCGLLPSFDWSCLSRPGAPGTRYARSMGDVHHHCCESPSNSGDGAVTIAGNHQGCQSDTEESSDPPRPASCRRCYDEGHSVSVRNTIDDVHTGSPRILYSGCLHGLVTNVSASISHWAIADAQILLQRCLAELAHYALKDRRRLQSPSASIWACECGTTVPRRRLLKVTSRRLSSVGEEGRRAHGSFSQRSYSRTKGHFRREKCVGVHQGDCQKENVGSGRRILQQRSEVHAKDEYSGLFVYAICRADINVCAEIRGQLKQQLVTCIKRSLKPRPVVIAAGSSAEDAAMMQEATVGIMVLCSSAQTEIATNELRWMPPSEADQVTFGEGGERIPVLRQLSRSFLDSARRTYHALLPLLPEHEPAAERGKSLPLPGPAESRLASKGQMDSMELGLTGLTKQGSHLQQQQDMTLEHQQASQVSKRGSGRLGRDSISKNGAFEPCIQAACLYGGSADVVLASFQSLCSLIFRNALFEQAQSLLLIDQVVYSTSLLSSFVFALLLTNLLDYEDPTGSVFCIWFSLIAVAAACLVGHPMAASLDDECFWTACEGILTSVATFALGHQAVFKGMQVGALLHLTDFFLIALCFGVVVRPWLVALNIGGCAARGRVLKGVWQGLQNAFCRRAAVACWANEGCSSCGCKPGAVRPLLLRTAATDASAPAGGSRLRFDRTDHTEDQYRTVSQPSACAADINSHQNREAYMLQTARETIASPYSSVDDLHLTSMHASMRPCGIESMAHRDSALLMDFRETKASDMFILLCYKRIGACFAHLRPLCIVMALASFPWLLTVLQFLLFYGGTSGMRQLHLLPYGFPAWWLVLLPCVAVAMLVAGLFRRFNLLLGPEKVLLAADGMCAEEPETGADDLPARHIEHCGSRYQQRQRPYSVCFNRGKQDAEMSPQTCRLCWTLEATDAFMLRELESNTENYEVQDCQMETRCLGLMEVGCSSAFCRRSFITGAALCSYHRRHHLLFLQRVASRLPAPFFFSLLNGEAVRHSLSLHPRGKALVRSSRTLAIGGLLVGMGTTTDSGDERNLRRGMTDTTSMFSESNVVVEDDWSSESFFGSESDFEAFTPSAPAVVCDEAATEQRANDALKGITLTFRDPYLEADYQSARERELRRSTVVFRSTLAVFLVLGVIFNLVTHNVHNGSAEGMDTSLSVILVVAVMLRLPFKLATALNLFYVLSSTIRYFLGFYNQSYFCRFACTISPPRLLSPLVTTPCAEGFSLDRLGRCIPVDSELHQLMAPLRTRQELLAVAAAYEIGSTAEEVLSKLTCVRITSPQPWERPMNMPNAIPYYLCSPPLFLSVLFCDVADFHNLVCAFSLPQDLVKLLDALFLCFDKLSEQFQLVKIETVFETYLAAAGLNDPVLADDAAGQMDDERDTFGERDLLKVQQGAFSAVETALAMLQVTMYITYDSAEPPARGPEEARSQSSSPRDADASQGVNDSGGQRQTRRLRVKIGIHSGNVISASFCAPREHTSEIHACFVGVADGIHISGATHRFVAHDQQFKWREMIVDVKGKGPMQTYLLDHVVGMRTPLDEATARVPDSAGHGRNLSAGSSTLLFPQESEDVSSYFHGASQWPRQHRSRHWQDPNITVPKSSTVYPEAASQRLADRPDSYSPGGGTSRGVPVVDEPFHCAGCQSMSLVSESSADCAASRPWCALHQSSSSLDALGGGVAAEICGRNDCDSNTECVSLAKESVPLDGRSTLSNERSSRWRGAERMQRITNAVASVFSPVQFGSSSRRRRSGSQVRQANRNRSRSASSSADNPWRRAGTGGAGRTDLEEPLCRLANGGEDDIGRLKLSSRLTRAFGLNARTDMVRLRFCSSDMEDSYKHSFYSDKAHINAIEQAIIIFLVAFVHESIAFLSMDRLSPATCELFQTQRMLWMGIRWLIFWLNLLFIFAALAFVLTNARDPGKKIASEWHTADTVELSFFLTLIHHNTGLLFQHIIFVDALLITASVSSAMLVSQPTTERLRGMLIVCLLLVVNLISCYVREHDDRQTYIVNQEASALERRSLELLNDMLPKELLIEFQNDNLRLAYSHESLAFLFADICGFTAWSRSVSAEQVLSLLQRLFTRFDRDTIMLNLYKLCTIGDAYVAVSGLHIDSPAQEPFSKHPEAFSGPSVAPRVGGQTEEVSNSQWRSQWEAVCGGDSGCCRDRQETDKACRILCMARQMLEHVQAVREEMQVPGLNMRIGLHVGSCVGGVIGSRRLRYDLWGLDVLVGNDIESNGVPGRCTIAAREVIRKPRGAVLLAPHDVLL
ncbi:Guanylyl cyclase, related [Eimeria praecox]|uniref:Guanylyl cyclase, related n=1 Tax=Eimeria praecox TaxID=51316 RepID=U6G8Q2_9EIME|nr:Guanylyl cyclase, related [Eimeria praecox]